MNPTARRLGISALALLLSVETFAITDTNRELARIYVNFYIRNAEYGAAQEYLSEHLRVDREDASGWNLLDMTFIRTRKDEKAVQAFYRAVTYAPKDDPDRPIYMYHYADALIRTGDREKAEIVLSQLKGGAESASHANARLVASRAEEALADLQPGRPIPELALGSRLSFQGALSLSAGYDGNVLLTSDGSLATVSQSETASPFVIPAVQGVWDFPAFQGRGTVTAVGAFTYQTNTNAQRFNSLFSSLEAAWAPDFADDARLTWGGYEDTDVIFVNDDGFGLFNLTQTLGGRIQFRHSERNVSTFVLPVRYLHYPLGGDEAEFNDRSGLSLRPGIFHRREVGWGILEAGFEFERHFAAGENYVATGFAFPVSWTQPAFWGTTWKTSVEASFTDFTENLDGRGDKVLSLEVSFTRPLAPRMYGMLDLGFRRNVSTLDEATYSKFSAAILVGYQL